MRPFGGRIWGQNKEGIGLQRKYIKHKQRSETTERKTPKKGDVKKKGMYSLLDVLSVI